MNFFINPFLGDLFFLGPPGEMDRMERPGGDLLTAGGPPRSYFTYPVADLQTGSTHHACASRARPCPYRTVGGPSAWGVPKNRSPKKD